MNKAKVSYILQTSIGMIVVIGLAIAAAAKFYKAEHLSLPSQIAIWMFLCVLIAYFIFTLMRFYKKMNDQDSGKEPGQK